jgi:hypothetical protein
VDIVTLAQVITSVTNLLFVIVLAAGYYFTGGSAKPRWRRCGLSARRWVVRL